MLQTGDIIKYLRTKNNLTQSELASILEIQLSTFQKYENGMIQNIKLKTLKKLCETFEVTPFVFVFPEKLCCLEHAEKFRLLNEEQRHRYAKLNEKGLDKIEEFVKDIYDTGNYIE